MPEGSKAGAIAGLVLGAAVFLVLTIGLWNYSLSLITSVLSEPGLQRSQGFVTQAWFWVFAIGLMLDLVVGAILGTIAGYIFTKTVGKLPVRSTYIKAVLFCFILWLIPVLLVRRSMLFGYFEVFLIVLVLFVLDALLFAYLFDRWTRSDIRTRLGKLT